MRTKRILSILLAAIMAVGAFGIVGVYAEEPEVAQGVGAQGWNNVVTLYEDASLAGSVSEAVIVWDAYLGTANKKPDDLDSFFTHNGNGDATFQWNAWQATSDTDLSTTVPLDIKASHNLAINTSGIYWEISSNTVSTELKLIITQIKGYEYYGWVRANLTVTVLGGTPVTSPNIWVNLRNPKKLADRILDADKELAKTDRYTKAYLDNLKLVNDACKNLLKTGKPSQAVIDQWLDTLNKAIDGKDSAGVSVGKRYKLTGWEWFDKIFSDNALKNIWGIIDVFKPIVDFFGQIGRALGFLIGLFGGLGGLFK